MEFSFSAFLEEGAATGAPDAEPWLAAHDDHDKNDHENYVPVGDGHPPPDATLHFSRWFAFTQIVFIAGFVWVLVNLVAMMV